MPVLAIVVMHALRATRGGVGDGQSEPLQTRPLHADEIRVALSPTASCCCATSVSSRASAMDAVASLTEVPILQRASGELVVSVKRRGTASVLDGLRQAGCLKARFPRPVADGWMDVAMLNTSGGVAGGDRLDVTLALQAGARATIVTPAAERFYRALPGDSPALVRNRVVLAGGACAEWLPQESLLFERCALDRQLEVELADHSWFLGAEALVFGRAAMGEDIHRAWLRDAIRVRRDGRWLLHEAVRLDGDVGAMMRTAAVAVGHRALATLVWVAPEAEAALDGVRAALRDSPVEAGASAWNGMLVARILATAGAALRVAIVAVLSLLRGSRPLPRVWQC